MKYNYRAWKIREKDLSKLSQSQKFEHLIAYAVLAPSSHNSQPWKFTLKENKVILEPDLSRHLPESDANQRQMYISIGCALANFLIAGDFFGIDFSIFEAEKQMNSISLHSTYYYWTLPDGTV